jgi:four helix bundle protein
MNGHKDLLVWQKSIDHVLHIYKATGEYPKEELFGIVSQMRRAAVSVPSNIAEGYGRVYGKETSKFLSNALGSATELETQLIISRDLGFLSVIQAEAMIGEIAEIIRMLTSLIKSLDK